MLVPMAGEQRRSTTGLLPVQDEPEPGGTVAVFDLDRTLLPGSSLGLFARGLARARLVSTWDVARHVVHQGVFTARGLSASTLERLCAELAAGAAG
jgi:phosphoserine phosphatase